MQVDYQMTKLKLFPVTKHMQYLYTVKCDPLEVSR